MENKENNIPLSVAIENTKGKMAIAMNQIISESHLPAFLIEGILLGILSDVRNQKNLELVSDYNSMKNDKKEGEE